MTRPQLELAVFDLDYTVWQPEMYQLWGQPTLVDCTKHKLSESKRDQAKTIKDDKILVDGQGSPMLVFPGASYALASIKRMNAEGHDIKAAVASRTDQPRWAEFCMDHLVVDDDGTTLSDCFENRVEISYNDKTHHFRRLQRQTGIPFSNMVFFDNEHWNIRQVSKLGVKCIYTPDGMEKEHWDQAKAEFGL